MRSRPPKPLTIMITLRHVTLGTLVLATLASVLLVYALKPTDFLTHAILSLWLAVPYFLLGAIMVYMATHRPIRRYWHITFILVAVAGPLFLADIIYWHPDPQGAIAVLMAPMLQGCLLLGMMLLGQWRKVTV